MKMTLLIAGGCCAAAIIALAAQNRAVDSGGPVSRLASTLDTNGDGIISAAEIRAASSALNVLDANGDGRLTSEELRPLFGGRPQGGQPPDGPRGRGDGDAGRTSVSSADDLTDSLMAFDRNSDNKLERVEVPERFQGLFDRADANKDGVLTRDELKQSASATVEGDQRGRPGGAGRGFGRDGGRGGMLDPLMRALDIDRDGALSPAESTAAADALKTLDLNHDGQLSGEEFRAVPTFGRGRRR
jgi:Ca2+-binding EF-hand superfamily protein